MATTLKNGATVIAEHDHPRKGKVVLCQFGTEFVTWVLDLKRNAHWGHYFSPEAHRDSAIPAAAALKSALTDFLERIGEEDENLANRLVPVLHGKNGFLTTN